MKYNNYDLITAHFFFVDMVGLSNPKISTKIQARKIEILNKLILECNAFKTTKRNSMIKLSTGDGLVIAFLLDQQLPLKLAIQLHQKIAKYNKSKNPSEILQVRIGLHSGNVYLVKDINDKYVLWGPGIILARRVMDLGDANHILLTGRMAKDLTEISDYYSAILHEIEDFVIKHDQIIPVYSAFGEGFGNSQIPKIGMMQGIREEISKTNKNILYSSTSVIIRIKDPTRMLTKHIRTYEIKNASDNPIHEVVHGIGTDVKTTLEELKIKVYDENKQPLKINKIIMDYPFQKEFTTLFSKPVLKNQNGRKYTLEYETIEPERYYENNFMVAVPDFKMTFQYPTKSKLSPMLYRMSSDGGKKKKLSTYSRTSNPTTTSISWQIKSNSRGDTLRIEW